MGTNIKNSWYKKSFFPSDIVSKQLKGKDIMLFIPLEINGKVINYQFVFRIDEV